MSANDAENLSDLFDTNIEKIIKANADKLDKVYSQIESLFWLQKKMKIQGSLPPLRGWAASPDVLLKLHTYIIKSKPKLIVEFGSGASTIVIADALRQNGFGLLVSIEHSVDFGKDTLSLLNYEFLDPWVDFRIGELESWNSYHMNVREKEKPSKWYPESVLSNIEGVDLILVDGPPASTCQFARYPALPTLFEKLSDNAQIWMDDTARRDEKAVCQRWADDYEFDLKFFSLEKGLGILS
ncbi:class I SAM-dependent methyltransferase [Vreelandella sp. EE7]